MVYILSVISSSKCSLFHNSKVFVSCIIHILYTGCAKIKKKYISGAKRLNMFAVSQLLFERDEGVLGGDQESKRAPFSISLTLQTPDMKAQDCESMLLVLAESQD